MEISVVISTYNGEKFIIEQLESIKNQTRQPDEVIISDDCSKDKTFEIIKKYIKDNKLSNWKLNLNTKNKGYKRNFLDTAKISSGGIIFYCDQDDIWELDKIELMEKIINEKNAIAAYCLTDSIDEEGKKIKNLVERLNRIITLRKIKKITLEQKIKYARSPGLCLAFKREILNDIDEISADYNLPHDLQVGSIAAIKDGYYLVNKVLVHRRIHNNNASLPITNIKVSISSIDRQIKSREVKLNELIAIKNLYKNQISLKQLKEIDKAIKITNVIIESLKTRNIINLIKLMFFRCKMINKLLLIRNILSIL